MTGDGRGAILPPAAGVVLLSLQGSKAPSSRRPSAATSHLSPRTDQTLAQLLTVTDAANLLGITASGMRRLENKGHIASMRTAGGVRLFTRDDVVKLRDRRAARVASRT